MSPFVSARRTRLPSTAVLVACVGWAAAACASAPANSPSWLFPINPAAPEAVAPPSSTPLRVSGSAVAFTAAQLKDMFNVTDWFPKSHATMPEVVAHGRAPDVYACGYCHTPAGQGRPENAPLAGLPAAYIVAQLADFKSGSRRSAGPENFLPPVYMVHLAAAVSEPEARAAADYFSRQSLRPHVRIEEVSQVPRYAVSGWVYVADAAGGEEILGERLLEFTPDATRHELRDVGLVYTAYVPRGSLRRGRELVASGTGRAGTACTGCHGQKLGGVGAIPGIAGRDPTYLLRQLVAFKSGARAADAGAPMRAVAAALELRDMIAASAYAASLQP